jgi:ferredoxin-type protein NapF
MVFTASLATRMTDTQISRRQLLGGRLRGGPAAVRPPWAAAEDAFVTECDRCGDCGVACPERVIRVGDGGFPVVDFALGGCSFCAECVTACRGRALKADPERDPPWALIARIGSACLATRGVVCRSCGEVCDQGAVRFRPRVGGAAKPQLNAERCTGCGHCMSICPVQAVTIETPARPEQESAVAALESPRP